jgi:hypothetical protein
MKFMKRLIRLRFGGPVYPKRDAFGTAKAGEKFGFDSPLLASEESAVRHGELPRGS